MRIYREVTNLPDEEVFRYLDITVTYLSKLYDGLKDMEILTEDRARILSQTKELLIRIRGELG